MQITLDTTDLLDVTDKLRLLDATTLSELRRATVDVVALTVRTKSINDTVKQLNLTRDYVEARIARDETQASGNAAKALLRSQVRGATLQRFTGSRINTAPVNWSNSRIQDMGKKFGKWSGWTYRKGDALRGIPENMKSAGYTVDVNRKGEKTIASAFTLPLRRGTADGGNGVGVFQRPKGGGDLKHLYGPSVYQTFRRYITENQQTINDELRDTFLGGLDDRLRKL